MEPQEAWTNDASVIASMSPTSRHLLSFLARRLCSLGPPLPAVFIMGHMRCGSTLLLHILIDNPEIIGCGERNAAYRSHLDLDKLAIEARLAQRAPFRRVRYAVDQINHDEFTPDGDLLHDPRVRLVFLTREPEATIRSIIELTRTFYGNAWTVEKAIDYYCRRLRTLGAHAAEVKEKSHAMALSYEALVDDTAPTLERLGGFLGVRKPLAGEYGMQRFTGARGDPSEKIRAGRIVRRRVAPGDEIPSDALEEAERAHAEFRKAADSLVA